MTNAPALKRSVSPNGDSGAEEAESAPPPPDGGWGWMVVFASFMIHVVTDGVTYSFGVFYVEFLNYFQEGKGTTAWIASILVGVTFCSGPISSLFVNKYGCRVVTIAGSILGFACLVFSIFAKNVITLYFTIGLGAGLGFGLIYLPAIVSVTCYFEKYRSLATGIAVCGSGLGTFIFAPLTEFLVDEFGWRGAMLLIASLVLQCSTFGALFRPVEEYHKPKIRNEAHLTRKLLEKEEHREEEREDSGQGKLNGAAAMQRPVSLGNFATPRQNTLQVLTPKETNPHEANRLTASQPVLVSMATTSQGSDSSRHTFGSQSGIMHRRGVLYHASLTNIPQYNHRHSSRSSVRVSHERTEDKYGETLASGRRSMTPKLCGIIPCSEESMDTLKQMLDFSLFKDPVFILFTVSNFCTAVGFNIPYVYIVAQAQERGIPKEKASYLLAVIGIANTVGRVILGYVSDKTWINRLFVYNTCLTVCGLATALSALCYDFYSFTVYGCVYGVTIGAYVGLTSVILVDLLGLDHLTNAFGLLLLFQGIASLIGPPIAGWLYDAFETYDPGFIVSGSMLAISGLMLYFIPPMQRYLKRRNRNRKDVGIALS